MSTTTPSPAKPIFSSSDPELDQLYRAGVRTTELNSFDAFTDCPTREQRAWVGDGVVHQMVHLVANEDWRLARNYVTLGASPRADGMLPMSVAGEIEHRGGYTIPDWALHWVHGVWNLFRHDGDRTATLELVPVVERVLRWYEPYIDDHGTLSDVPEWNLIDWSSVFSSHRSSLITGLWARGLVEYAEMSEWLGQTASADWARGLWVGCVMATRTSGTLLVAAMSITSSMASRCPDVPAGRRSGDRVGSGTGTGGPASST